MVDGVRGASRKPDLEKRNHKRTVKFAVRGTVRGNEGTDGHKSKSPRGTVESWEHLLGNPRERNWEWGDKGIDADLRL